MTTIPTAIGAANELQTRIGKLDFSRALKAPGEKAAWLTAYDVAFARFGVMFFDDPIRAFTNIRSGMKAGGRLVFVCFRTMPESPWFRVPIDAARPHVPPQPPVDPLAPGMFSLAREERQVVDVEGLLTSPPTAPSPTMVGN